MLLNVDGLPSKGPSTAKVTIIEFSDYECPFCTRHTRQTWPQLEAEYVATGKVKYVFRNFPIPSLHKQAMKAHEAAMCAGDQGKYWPMREVLFKNSPALGEPALVAYARQAGLAVDDFQTCLQSGKHASQISGDIAEAQKAGMTGTPTFFLGMTPAPGAKLQAVRVLRGAQPYAAFKQAIDWLLALQPPAPKKK